MNSENTQIINDNIKLIKDFINKEKFKNLKINDYDKYKSELEQLFPSFSKTYEFLFKKVINNENLDMLDNILNIMNKIKHNELSEEDGMKVFDEILAEKYLYPVLGKPQSNNK